MLVRYPPRTRTIEQGVNNPPPLDYATPPAPRSPALSSIVAAASGTLAGLFGVMMLVYGVMGIVWLAGEWKRWKFLDGGDVFGVGMFLLIGAVSAFFGVRWLRSSIKGTGGKAGG